MFVGTEVQVSEVNPAQWLSRETGDDVISEGGVRGESERSDWWRAGMGGVRADAVVCWHRWAENPPLESNDQSDPVCGDRSAYQQIGNIQLSWLNYVIKF